MKHRIISFSLIAAFVQIAASRPMSVETAAARFVLGVKWRANSVVIADFTCQGRKQQAILGVTSSEAVIAVFLKGTNQRPEVLRYSRSLTSVVLQVEDLNFDPDYALPGFKRSRTCKGLNLSDGEIDSAHIYWNHIARRFDAWSL